jgi:hypothetical protein
METPVAAAAEPQVAPTLSKPRSNKIPRAAPTQGLADERPPPEKEVLIAPTREAVEGSAFSKMTDKIAQDMADDVRKGRDFAAERDKDAARRVGALSFGDLLDKTGTPNMAQLPAAATAAAAGSGRKKAGTAAPEPAPTASEQKEEDYDQNIYTSYFNTFSRNPSISGIQWIEPSQWWRLSPDQRTKLLESVRKAVNMSAGIAGNPQEAYGDLITSLGQGVNMLIKWGVLHKAFYIECPERLGEEIAVSEDEELKMDLAQLYCEWINWINLGPHSRLALRTMKILRNQHPEGRRRERVQSEKARNTPPPANSKFSSL